jgi:hypothetical protein
MDQEEDCMKAETVQKAFEIVQKIKSISDNIEIMERGHGEIIYFTDIFLDEMWARHKQEVMETFRIRKAELEKELADL